MSEKNLIWLILSTLIIQALWTLHPDALLASNDIPVYKMFPFSETLISKPTYIYFICRHAVYLIYIRVWWSVFQNYKHLFGAWFWIQAVQFGEFFLNYNEAQLWFFIGSYKLDVDFTLLKMAGLPIMFLVYDYIWVRK